MKGFYHWIKVFVVIIGLTACQKNERFMSHQELSDKDSDEYYIVWWTAMSLNIKRATSLSRCALLFTLYLLLST